jgi:ubiquinone/menaquinone biosynthesis C-methylase UbiE
MAKREEFKDRPILKEQLAYYCARAPEYDESFLQRGRHDRGPELRKKWLGEVREIQRALQANMRGGTVLELACGTGIWTRHLSKYSVGVFAVDASPEVIALNRQRVGGANVEYLVADIFSWTPPVVFDAVFFSFWLSHVPASRFKEFWETVRISLKPSGSVFFIDTLGEENPVSRCVEPYRGAEVVRRTLNDGREFDIIKVSYRPSKLQRRLVNLGWEGWVRQTGKYFLYGFMRRADNTISLV